MPQPLIITLPAEDNTLYDELEQELGRYGTVQETPPTYGVNEIKLILDIATDIASTVAGGASLATFFLLLKDRYKKTGQPSGVKIAKGAEPPIPLESMDEASLQRLTTANTDEKSTPQ